MEIEIATLMQGALVILGSGSFVGVVGWTLQLGNRVTRLETKEEDLPNLLRAEFATVNSELSGLKQRLERMEKAMNGALREHQ